MGGAGSAAGAGSADAVHSVGGKRGGIPPAFFFSLSINNNMEGTRPKPYRIGGHPAPDGASPTQPY